MPRSCPEHVESHWLKGSQAQSTGFTRTYLRPAPSHDICATSSSLSRTQKESRTQLLDQPHLHTPRPVCEHCADSLFLFLQCIKNLQLSDRENNVVQVKDTIGQDEGDVQPRIHLPRYTTACHRKSFLPVAIRLYNSSL